MNAAIKNLSFNEIDAAIKNLNISSKDKIELTTPDELFLFKPKILQAIDCIREKRFSQYKCHLQVPEEN